jgi:phospholipase/carboxylesterase
LLGDTNRVFIGGFSQGCSLALATYLCFDDGPLGGVVGCSGIHCANLEWSKVNIQAKRKTPVFLYHGLFDEIIISEYAHMSKELLQEKGLDHIELAIENELDHTVSPEELGKISDFFHRHMNNINL